MRNWKTKGRPKPLTRNKRSIPKGTLSSVWRQAGINREIAEKILGKRNK